MPNQKKTSLVIPVSVIILLAATVLYLFNDINANTGDGLFTSRASLASFTPTGVSVSYDYDSQPYFYSNSSNSFYFATKDGISYINADGRTKWNYVYNFSQPTVKAEKDVVAVSEIKGRSVHVFNSSGRLYSKEFDQSVLFFSVNRLGYLIVTLKKDSDYQTMAYDSKGELIFESGHQEDNQYPITSDISGDGRIIVSNILNVSGLQMASSLLFTYTYSNSFAPYSSRNKDGQLISVTGFLEGNRLISVSDNEISAFASGEENLLQDITTISLNNKLSYFEFMGERGFAIILGQGILNKQADPENMIKLYDSQAIETGRFDLGKKATYLHASANAIIAGSYSSYNAISDKGNLLWEYVVPYDVKQMIFLGNTDTILIASNAEAGVYKRSRNPRPTATPDTEDDAEPALTQEGS